MAARSVVVLGGGIGGQVAARSLRRRLPTGDRVVLVERNARFSFPPSCLWVLSGTRRPAQISRTLHGLQRPGTCQFAIYPLGVEDLGPPLKAALTAAALRHVPVLAWALPDAVARQLNTEFGTSFIGRPADELDVVIEVERGCQRAAISCHASQSTDNPVLWRRLGLLGERENLRWLSGPPSPTPT
jgi:hypothetical protein